MPFFQQFSLLRTWRQAYPRLVFIEIEIVPSPSTNHAHIVIAQYNVVRLFTTSSSSTATVAAGWLLHVTSQVTGTALMAGSDQSLGVHNLRFLESL